MSNISKGETQKKTVAIIGAGASGLCTAKYMTDNGLVPTIFEKEAAVGGLWSKLNDHNAVWDGLRANVSYFFMAYSGLEYPKNSPIFSGKQELSRYFEKYMEKFQLEQFIKYNTNVTLCSQREDKRWTVTYESDGKEAKSETFDFLVMASGLHENGRIPKCDGQDKFKGLIMHSSQFRLQDPRLKNKRVVVLGHSYSATDVAQNSVDLAQSVVNVFRRPYLVVRRLVRYKSDKCGKNQFHVAPIDCVEFKRVNAFEGKTAEERAKMREGACVLNHEQVDLDKSHPELFYDTSVDAELRITIADNYWAFVKQNKITPKQGTFKEFTETGVYLNDGTFLECDVVIYATGYNLPITYLDEKAKTTLELDEANYKMPFLQYKFTFHPDLENAAFLCQNEGLFYTASELQAHWISRVFSGKQALPPREEMIKEIDMLRQKRQLSPDQQYVYGEHVRIIDHVAEMAGLLPDFEGLKKNEPIVHNQLMNCCAVALNHFLNDEAKGKDARRVMQEIEDMTSAVYEFDDDDETDDCSIRLLAQKFATKHAIDMDIFKT